MKKALVTLLAAYTCACAATSLRFMNFVEPRHDIWVGVDEQNLTRIKNSQLFTRSSIKKIYWKYTEDGTLFSDVIDWGFFDVGTVAIYRDTFAVHSARGTLRKNLEDAIASAVKGAKAAREAVTDLASHAVQAVTGPLKELVKREQAAVKENPYATKQAAVRQGAALCAEEFAYRTARLPHVQKHQEALIGTTFAAAERPLEIGIVLSGGGVRSLYASLGELAALQMVGILDTAMTITSLSGSTWALFPWLQGDPAHNNRPLPLRDFLTSMLPRFEQGLLLSTTPPHSIAELRMITDMFLVKFAYDQPVNAVIDLYGALLANKLLLQFGDKRQRVHISAIGPTLATGRFPLPVGTAKLDEGDWFEVTPFECGSRWLGTQGGAYVPTWAFGRLFGREQPGVSSDVAPEQSAGFFAGMFGSAIAASLKETYHAIIKDMSIPAVLKDSLQWMVSTELGTIRSVWAEVYNPFIQELRKLSKDLI